MDDDGRPRHTTLREVEHVLVVWIVSAGTLLLLSELLGDVAIDSFAAALAGAAAIGLINALVWPLVLRFALPLTVFTLGLGVVWINGAIVLAVAAIDSGIHIESVWAGVVVALVLATANMIATSLLGIDDDAFWYRNVVRRYQKRAAPGAHTDVPGLFFLEIDGLAHDVLVRAMRDGNAPTMARWLEGGSHGLVRWETDWSSQTGACQAGLLHGNNEDMPAFRWWEKDLGAAIVTNHPRDAMELERRVSNGKGLLYADGASRANILLGDAPHSLLTMSTALRRDRSGRIGQDYFAYFANPYNIMRTIAHVGREVVSELWSARQQRRRDVRPRVPRGFVYSLMRAWATVIQLDLQVQSIIADMYAGRPVAYTTFLAYDEVAHHSGIERPETLLTLKRVDRQIARIAREAARSPRPYRLAVLSDHGQSQGETFADRYGVSLDELVHQGAEAAPAVVEGDSTETKAFLGASIAEASSGDSHVARAVRRASSARVEGDDRPEDKEAPPEIVVMASGCLGLISFPRMPGRVTLEEIESTHPNLIPTLREHPGIGFLLVRSAAQGALAIGPRGINYLDEERVEGEDPLESFGPRAARHVKRTDGFPHCPDIVVNSTYWADTDEVAAFEELVGSHGGLGGTQSYPFLLHPLELELPAEQIVGSETVHAHLRRWLAQLGHEEYDADLTLTG